MINKDYNNNKLLILNALKYLNSNINYNLKLITLSISPKTINYKTHNRIIRY
jgi:hypothetical protein